MTNKNPTFEQAVKLYRQWGFEVDPGPRPGEVSLIIRGQAHVNTTVYPARILPEMAEIALRARWANGGFGGNGRSGIVH